MRGVALTLAAAAVGTHAAQIRITCIGDSITAGVCSSQTHGYPAILQGLLGSGYLVRTRNAFRVSSALREAPEADRALCPAPP
jgi:lysophospholipase L1-like esterase